MCWLSYIHIRDPLNLNLNPKITHWACTSPSKENTNICTQLGSFKNYVDKILVFFDQLPTPSFQFLASTKMNSLETKYSVSTPSSQRSFLMTLCAWGDLTPDFCDKKSQVLHEFNCLIFNFPVERISHIWRLKYLLSLSLCRYFAQFSSCHPTPPATVSYFLCFDKKKSGTN